MQQQHRTGSSGGAAGALRQASARAGGKGAASASVPTRFVVDVHGETYRINITRCWHPDKRQAALLPVHRRHAEEVVFEPLNAFVSGGSSRHQQASAPGDVTTTMPGNIVDVLVGIGDVVKTGKAVLITEANRIEAGCTATQSNGTVKAVHVAKGDRVNPASSAGRDRVTAYMLRG